MQLKILSWNIWNDGDFAQISAFLKKFDADIIGLQEVMLDDPTRDVIGYLKKLDYEYVCAPVKKDKDGKKNDEQRGFQQTENSTDDNAYFIRGTQS